MLRALLLEPLFNLLLFFYAVIPGNDFGVAVIALTILLRLALWPLVKKQLVSQTAMRELQPQIAKIKQRAKGDKQKESQLMVELFKEKKVNPFGSLGLAFAQLPILIALFFALQEVVVGGNVAANTYSFIQNLPAVSRIIANPEAFDPTLFGLVHMATPSLVLAGLAGLAQYAQAKQLAPQNTSASDPMAKFGLNLTFIFPILTVAIATQLPSALALYWAVSSLVAVVQQQAALATDVSFMQRLLRRRPGVAEQTSATKPPSAAANKTPKLKPKPGAKSKRRR